jgi:hypothetical protein
MEPRSPASKDSPNRLLQKLSEADRTLVQPHLEPVSLTRNDVCIEPGAPITHVYFLEGGLSSTVMPDQPRGTAELGVQGYEGLIGVPAILGADQSPYKVFMQVGGRPSGLRSNLSDTPWNKAPPCGGSFCFMLRSS